jgi:NAD(P)-dependent dehydrogenase (short-subunit alcohol dehydrogenase family)
MKAVTVDLASEADFDAATSTLQKQHPEFRPNVIINATGLLHDINGDHGTPLRPETSIKQLSSANFRRVFDANVLGNFLAVRYFLGELADKKADSGVFATLSARVGSITDNTAGGWYSYRCSKVCTP